MEMRLILAHVLFRFDLSLTPGMQPQQGWINAQKIYGLWEKVRLINLLSLMRIA